MAASLCPTAQVHDAVRLDPSRARNTSSVRAGSFVDVDGLTNFRDVGGLPTPDGVVRRRLLFRSDGLDQVSDDGRARLAELGVETIIDLRTYEERAERKGPLPSVHVPLHEEFDDDDLVDSRRLLGRAEGEAKLRALYLLLLERARPQFRSIFATLADRARLPAIVHCAGGKDRTGITIALVLSALGVPREDVLDDFALQSPSPEWARRREALHARFVGFGIEPEAARGLLSAPRWTMQDALGWLDATYGGVEEYLCSACSLEPSMLADLRANLVEREA